MIVLCTKCGERLSEGGERCGCCDRNPSLFVDVAMTAAKLGGAERPENIRAAVLALTARPS